MPKIKFSNKNKKKFLRNLLVFLSVPAIAYLSPLPAELAEKGFSLQIFIPSQFEWGMIAGYVINSLIDLIKKLREDNS